MIKYMIFLLPIFAFSNQISIEHTKIQPLGKIIVTNAQITQLSNQKQKIVSRLQGHVEKYFVQPGQKVKNGDKVVLIESMELSRMSAEYIALIQQSKAAKNQLSTAKKLYKKGLTSQNNLNTQIIALEEIHSKQNVLSSQLKSLGVNASSLSKATDQFILYAHADGVVAEISVPLHSNVNAEDTLISLVKRTGYYAIAYLGMNDALKVTSSTKGFIKLSDKKYAAHFIQLLPNIDKETQRAQVLFMLDDTPKNILLGTFVEMEVALEPYRDAVMVKKSALTLFQGEWVVFIPMHHEEKDADEHKDHKNHEGDHEEEEGHENEAHNEHDEVPYAPKAVRIIAYYGDYVAIEGIDTEEEYISDGVYFVKSMILKSSLGEHGH
jgi:biotin carboxyl carrier protein